MSDHPDASTDVVSVERVIPAPPEAIFELLANPARHREIDGSGTVRDPRGGPSERLKLGSKFGMSMKVGVPYSMVSEVIEFDEPRRIAWQTRFPLGPLTHLNGGRIWRYELEPVDGGTLVTETWDISQERMKAIVRPSTNRTREAMASTLARIETLVAG